MCSASTAGLKGAPCGQAPCSEADDTGQPCCPVSECVCHIGYVAMFGLHVGAEAFSVQSSVPLRLLGNRKGCPIFKPFSSANLFQLTLQQQRMTACHSSLIQHFICGRTCVKTVQLKFCQSFLPSHSLHAPWLPPLPRTCGMEAPVCGHGYILGLSAIKTIQNDPL